MDTEAEQNILRQLDSGERLLWSGQPCQGIRLRAGDALFIPFSLVWGGFAIFWETLVFRSHAPLFFRLWGVPFVLVGLYLIVGRFFHDAWRRARTAYAITDRRVILVSGGLQRSTRSVSLRTLGEIALAERRDGSGDVVLGSIPFAGRFARGSWPGTASQVPELECVSRAREVYDIIRRAQSHAV